MASYYKYAEREAASVIDWTKISSSLVKTLEDENARREQLKAKIDENSFKFGEELNNSPQGDYKNANTWILNAADQGQQARLMQDRLLKSGQLKYKDYLVMRRNLEGDFKNLFAVAKEYQDEYKTKMENYQKGISSKAEGQIMETIESLANFTGTSPYINPTNGTINLSRNELVDGVYQPTGGYVSVQALRNRLKINVNKFQEKVLADDVESLGSTTVSELRRVKGLNRIIAVEKTKDPTARKALEDDKEIGTYLSWEDSKVDEYLANKFNTLSILTDYVGKNEKGEEFKLTYNEDEFNNDKTNKLYLMKDDGSGVLKPTFKPEQEEMVASHIRNKYRNMIDKEATMDVSQEPDIYRRSVAEMQYSAEQGEARKKKENALNMTSLLYRGNDQEVASAVEYFKQSVVDKDGKRLIKDINRKPNGMTITYFDGNTETIPFKDKNNNLIPQDRWVQSAVGLHGIKDINESTIKGSVDLSKPFNTTAEARASIQAPAVDKTSQYEELLKTEGKSLSNLVVKDNAKATAENLNSVFNGLGFTIENTSKQSYPGDLFNSTDYVTISYGGKKLGDVNLDESQNLIQFDNFFRNALKSSSPSEQAVPASDEARARMQTGYK